MAAQGLNFSFGVFAQLGVGLFGGELFGLDNAAVDIEVAAIGHGQAGQATAFTGDSGDSGRIGGVIRVGQGGVKLIEASPVGLEPIQNRGGACCRVSCGQVYVRKAFRSESIQPGQAMREGVLIKRREENLMS